MLSVSAKVDGDLTAAFDKLLEAAGESTLRATGVAGARVIQEQAIANTSRFKEPTGVIKKNIIIKRVTEESDGAKVQTYLVTVRKGKANYGNTKLNVRKNRVGAEYETGGDAYYWRWVEEGHDVVRKRKDDSVSLKAHRAAQEAEFGTSRVPAKPFMRPAYESKKGAALEAMKKRMAEKISEYLGQK